MATKNDNRREVAFSMKLPASLMNNTKWREVWTVLAELRLRIHFAYADQTSWNDDNSGKLQGPFPVDYVQERGIGDPGIGGPFFYKQILWIRVPRIYGNDVGAFCQRVEALGRLPISVGDDFVEIRGYHVAAATPQHS